MDSSDDASLPQQPYDSQTHQLDQGDRVLQFIEHLSRVNADSASKTSNAIKGLSRALQTQSLSDVSKNIDKFDGNPKNFRKWMSAIDVAGRLNLKLSDQDMIRVMHDTATGPVADYILRMRESCVNLQDLITGLTKNFSAVTDKDTAWTLFKNCRQRENESVGNFAERMCSLHCIAWGDKTKRAGPEAREIFEKELILTFQSGLKDREVRRALMKAHFNTFNEYLNLAVEESNISTRLDSGFSGTRREEPMDLTHIRQKRCAICLKFGHSARECRQRGQVARQQTQPPPQVNFIAPNRQPLIATPPHPPQPMSPQEGASQGHSNDIRNNNRHQHRQQVNFPASRQ